MEIGINKTHQRGIDGRFLKGNSYSPGTQFKKGQHWRKKKSYWDYDWLYNEYIIQQRSSQEIAKEFGCKDSNILYFLRKYNITIRSVSEAIKENHFATFPQKLVEPIIKASCPEEICNECNKPKLKLYKSAGGNTFNIRVKDVKKGRIKHIDRTASEKEVKNYNEKFNDKKIIEIVSCNCDKDFHPGVVLDPFIGSGTTGIVARKLNRNYIGIDLKYEDIQEGRKHKELGFFQ